MMKRCIITVGKPDAHKEIHFGHLSGGMVCADIYARFLRRELDDENVLFLSGTECYGSAVETAFSKKHIHNGSIKEYVRAKHNKQTSILSQFQIEFNNYYCDAIDEELHNIHTDLCQKMIDCLVANRDLYKKRERILLDQNGLFLNHREISLKSSAKGNTLFNEHYHFEPVENLISKQTGVPPTEKIVENYFLDFSKREKSLMATFSLHAPEYTKYMERTLSKKDESTSFRVTGNANWGIDLKIDGNQNKLWVWVDSILAPISYTIKSCKNYTDALTWWGSDDSKVIHYIAEDNLKFYCALESYLFSSWNDCNDKKMKIPQLKLTPMRTVKSEYGFPLGEDLLRYYTAEQIRFSIASMGNRSASFCPERYNTREMVDDNISCRCDSLLKKIDRLVKKARYQQDKKLLSETDANVIIIGEQIYNSYYREMCEQKTHRAIDIIEENLKYANNCEANAIYFARLFLHMLYPILPNYSIEKYHLLFNDDDILNKRNTLHCTSL